MILAVKTIFLFYVKDILAQSCDASGFAQWSEIETVGYETKALDRSASIFVDFLATASNLLSTSIFL